MSASATLTASPCFMTLDCFGFMELAGARSVDFLQGQLTCDLRQASATHAVAGAWCTPKGRVICSLMAWPRQADSVLLRLHADLLQATAEQLAKYAALSRVRITPAPVHCFGLLGPIDTLLQPMGLTAPLAAGDIQPVADGALLRCDATGERHELWVQQEAATQWRDRLRAALPEGNMNDWRLALVRVGVVEVEAATRELFLPQMLGYDQDERVSFRKGCYTGQEIIARTHYKGGVKRHLHRLIGRGEPPPPGSALERDGQSAGTVVGSACSGEGRCDILAVLSDELASAGAHVVLLAGGSEFHLPA